ncbi:glycosyltransferase [Candidatus Comchoanobacter bicostacola]|uniref:UDP-N-acetylglucosamine--N-acetylmuramyl-(pentapeptide) pyrophosphoryl-undecaprenol N-acetylglucosamine transferase n=1 Tax=Candidatus Comchoanobacter bicostacola TaxID=2919598 RepID=A0ABY5DHU5_9GAMM|nr:glycosyltransferase [Candidatus Comchoanobacter bicostacola]UTC24238.1 glycosyltransferase [Candidatus Comchoanobacter bicostacola]
MQLLVVAGSSGGHIMPAKRVAQAWLEEAGSCVWLGAANSLEASVAKQLGLPFEIHHPVNLRAIMKVGMWRTTVSLLQWFREIYSLLKKNKPDALFLTGSYVTLMPGLVAKILGIPVYVHEQNVVMGYANKCLTYLCRRLFLGLPMSAGMAYVGNPVKIVGNHEVKHEVQNLLIIGGSQGCRYFDETLPDLLSSCSDLVVIHIAGGRQAEVQARYDALGINAQVISFTDKIDDLYRWSSMVIARGGAMTLAELAAYALPAIIVPLPTASKNHQYLNALFYHQHKAIDVLQQDCASSKSKIHSFISDIKRRTGFSHQIKKLHKESSAHSMVDTIVGDLNADRA